MKPRISGLICLAFSLLLAVPVAQGKTYVVFRYDDFAGDIPEKRSEEPLRQEIWEKEKKIDEIFQKYGMPYLLAIIPERKSGKEFIPFGADYEKVDFVKKGIKENRIEVSQHGYRHINQVKPGHRASEFSERTYQEQYDDISKGKRVLETALGETIDIFVPPFNGWSYDTGRVLQKCNFAILSADRYYTYTSIDNLRVLPFTAQISEVETLDFDKIEQNAVIVILFHPSEMVDTGLKMGEYGEIQYVGLERLDNLLKKLKEQSGVEVVTMRKLCQMYNFDFRKYKEITAQYAFYRFLSPVLGYESKRNELLWVPITATTRGDEYRIKTVCTILIISILGVVSGLWIYKIFPDNILKLLVYFVIVITFFVLVKVFCVYHKGFTLLTIKHIGPIVFGASFWAGSLFHTMRDKKKKHAQ